jgi:hypothetical protein
MDFLHKLDDFIDNAPSLVEKGLQKAGLTIEGMNFSSH